MRFNRLDLNLLVCLDAVIAEKSVSKAADRVFIGQSAMSSALGRLREYFKDEILVRVGRTMVLTPLARSLAKPVRDILLQMHAVTSARVEFDPATSERRISLVASDYIATVFLTEMLPRVSVQAPRMRFEFHTLSERFQEEFDSGDVDMLLVPNVLLVSAHPSEVLFEDTFCCVVWKHNSQVANAISLRQYLSLGHVGIEWGAGRLRSLDEEALRRRGHVRRVEVVVPFFSLAAPLVVGTDRVATIQTRLANFMAQHWPVKVLPCPVALPSIAEAVQWHKHVDRDPAIVWLRGMLKAVASSLVSSRQNPRRSEHLWKPRPRGR